MSTMDGGAFSRVYAFHDLRIDVIAPEAVQAALHARLGRFASASPAQPVQSDLSFNYVRVEPGAPHAIERPLRARPVYDSKLGEVVYSDDEDRLFISCAAPIRVACDPGPGGTTLQIAAGDGEHLWLLAHPLFTLPLIESLKRRGLYSIHAAAVADGDRCVLFPGGSGAGKSTIALALLRAGFSFLGDDMQFLIRRAGGLRVLAFPETFDLTDDTVRLFPELHVLLEEKKMPGWPKRQFRGEERFGAPIAWECRPAALVFPHVANTGRSSLLPLDPGEALLELAPNILLTEPVSSQAHLDALAELVAACPCYRLETGSDFADLADRIRELTAVSE